MQRPSHLAPAPWSFTLLVLMLPACGPFAEEREQAEAERQRVQRVAFLQQMFERDIRRAGDRCREGVDGLRQLLLQYSDLTVQMSGKLEPVGVFAGDVAHAAADHDPSASCARLVDSVAKAVRTAYTRAHP